MKYILMLITFLIGILLPVQAVLNARVGRVTGGALMGAFISFFTGMGWLLIINLFTNAGALKQLKQNATGPWYIWMGGLIGAIFVGYVTWVNQRQGVALTFALVVSGQIIVSLAMDHYGLFGSTVRTITLQQVAGIVLLLVGLILIKK